MINNLFVQNPRSAAIVLGMADRNEDELNALNRKSLPELLDAAHRSMNQILWEAARPAADLVMPGLSEHSVGQLMQMLMLATVVEGRLMGVNPYARAGMEAYENNLKSLLKK